MGQRDSSPNNRRIDFAIGIGLAVLVWIVFGQTLHHQFVNFDDNLYVYENPVVRQGLTMRGVGWAFSHVVASNWHPLTILSHMLDCQIYGLNPADQHLTNLLLHGATAILFFLLLRRVTDKLWSSAFVAAVFAIHPLRAESVAWIAERKDVLSGFFFVLTLIAYAAYANQSKIKNRKSKLYYFLSLLSFALGLLSKPMLVTIPAVLLLLDYWPLARIGSSETQRKILVEKIPFALMSFAVCVITLLVQNSALSAGETIPPMQRFGNVFVSFAIYTMQFFYPANLSAFYPFPTKGWQVWQIGAACLFLVVVIIVAIRLRKRQPYLFFGWLWYLVMLLPVIGLIQVGAQSHADRYTYLPQIGLCIALTWGLVEFTAKWRNRATVLAASAAAIIVLLSVVARAQTAVWRDSETLWKHAIDCSSPNALAENNLATYYLHQGRLKDAIAHSQSALEIKRDYPDAHNCLGYALFQTGRYDDAIAQYQDALKLRPEFAAAHLNLGIALFQENHQAEAISEFQQAAKLAPDSVDAHSNLGAALVRTGQPAAAIAEYQTALRLDPNSPGVNNNFAWLLATCPDATIRDGNRAVPMAERANELSGGNNLIILRTLAATYGEAKRFEAAIRVATEAWQLAKNQNRNAWMQTLNSDIQSYKSNQPIRDSGK